MTPEEFAAAALTWVGVPWHHQGRSRHGVDCAGLPEAILREAGQLPEGYHYPLNYGRYPGEEMQRVFEQWCARLEGPCEGCLVQMKGLGQSLPSHVAILVGDCIVHAYSKVGRVVCQPYREPWVRLTVSYWRAPGVSP